MTAARILIAEDDPRTRELLAETLFIEGYEVEIAPNGEVALERVMHSHPDVILLDRKLPLKSGDEVLASIRGTPSCRTMAVFILSGLADAADRAALLRAGADDYLSKPFTPREVAARIEALLRRSRSPLLSAFEERTFLQMTQEMNIAREICERLHPNPPYFEGGEIISAQRPAREVGGDFVEYLNTSENGIILVNGDVSGHGLPAALSMIMLRTLLRQYALEEVSFDRILPKLAEFLRHESLPGHLASLALMRIDREKGEWQLASAGHPRPLLRHKSSVTVLETDGGTYLGVPDALNFPVARGAIAKGDIVLIYSDGLLEAIERGAVAHSVEQLKSMMRDAADIEDLKTRLDAVLPKILEDDVSWVACTIN